MANYSHETIEKIMLEMRRLMVREPTISARRMALLLGYDKNFMAKLKKKIDRRISKEIERSIVVDEIAQLENIYQAMALDLYEILTSSDKDSNKIMAFRELFKAKEKILQAKMDAGIFVRKLGELEHTVSDEDKAMLDQAIEFMYGKPPEADGKSKEDSK